MTGPRSHRRQFEALERRDLLTVTAELMLDIAPGPMSSSVQELYQFNGEVYFRANDGEHGSELWKTDGTAEGTVLVKDINPGDGSSSPGWLTEFNGELFFAATTDNAGDELWKTDGTSEGTVQVADINVGDDDALPQDLVVFNDELIFSARSGEFDDRELWKSNGTAEGTLRVKDIRKGEGDSDPGGLSGFYEFNGELYFDAEDDATGVELWKTDGTESGTVQVIDAEQGEDGSFPFGFFEHNDELYFLAERFDVESNQFLTFIFVIDGTSGEADTAFEIPIDRRTGVIEYDGDLYFSGLDAEAGFEVHRSDDSAAGASVVRDIFPGEMDSRPRGFFEFGGQLYFTAANTTDAENGKLIPRLWRTTGTRPLTFRVSQGQVDPDATMVAYNNDLYFGATDADAGLELFKTEGPFALEQLVHDVNPGDASSFPMPRFVLQDQLYFTATTAAHGLELWSTDGTAEGTSIVQDIFAGRGDFLSDPSQIHFFEFHGSFLFVAENQENGQELWIIGPEQSQTLPGDANGDGQVQFADFLILSANFGRDNATEAQGDFDGDGKVQFSDFLILSANFGKTLADIAAAAATDDGLGQMPLDEDDQDDAELDMASLDKLLADADAHQDAGSGLIHEA